MQRCKTYMESTRKKLYKEYGKMFSTFDIFCNVLDQITNDFACLVIKCNSNFDKFEENVFWYKADIHEDF